MKKTFIILSLLLTAGWGRATLFTYDPSPDVAITDGSPVGVALQGTVSGFGAGYAVQTITVGLDDEDDCKFEINQQHKHNESP